MEYEQQSLAQQHLLVLNKTTPPHVAIAPLLAPCVSSLYSDLTISSSASLYCESLIANCHFRIVTVRGLRLMIVGLVTWGNKVLSWGNSWVLSLGAISWFERGLVCCCYLFFDNLLLHSITIVKIDFLLILIVIMTMIIIVILISFNNFFIIDFYFFYH
jgi:hypothetical protein